MSALTNLTYLRLDGNTGLLYPPYSLLKDKVNLAEAWKRNVAEEVIEFCATHTHAEHRREVLWPQIRLLYIGNTDSSCCDTLGCLPVELIWVRVCCVVTGVCSVVAGVCCAVNVVVCLTLTCEEQVIEGFVRGNPFMPLDGGMKRVESAAPFYTTHS